MDKLDFLDGDTPAETPVAATEAPATPAPEPEAPAAEAPSGQPRAADGKFGPKAEAPAEAAPQAPATPPEAAQPQPQTPDRVSELEKQVAGLTKALTATRQQTRQPAEPAPDPYQDFEAYQAWHEEQQANERADWSRQIATLKYDAETLTAAEQWAAGKFESDPIFRQRAQSTRDPYGFAIEEYQRDQALNLLSDPKLLAQFQAWQAGTGPAPIQPAAASAPPPPQPVAPPPSITSAPSAGGAQSVPTGSGQAYGAIFG